LLPQSLVESRRADLGLDALLSCKLEKVVYHEPIQKFSCSYSIYLDANLELCNLDGLN